MVCENILTFIKTAERGSINRAAESLYISPTAVMKQINTLEEALGAKLFARGKRGVALTPAGKSLYDDSVKIVKDCVAAMERARTLAHSGENVIRVGNSLLNPCKELLDMWNAAGDADKSRYKIQIVPFGDTVEETDEIYHSMGAKFDVMIGACDIKGYSEMFSLLNVGFRRLCVAVPGTHRLASKTVISPADLSGETLIILKQGLSGILDSVRRDLRRRYPKIRLADSATYYDIDVFNRCEHEGALLLTLNAWKDVHPALVTIPFDIDYLIPYGIMYPLNPSAAVRGFIDIIENSVKKERL